MENNVYVLNGKGYKDFMPGSIKMSYMDAANKLGLSLGWKSDKNYGSKSKAYSLGVYHDNKFNSQTTLTPTPPNNLVKHAEVATNRLSRRSQIAKDQSSIWNRNFFKNATINSNGSRTVGQNTYFGNNRFVYKDPKTSKLRKGWWRMNVFGTPYVQYDDDTRRQFNGEKYWDPVN